MMGILGSGCLAVFESSSRYENQDPNWFPAPSGSPMCTARVEASSAISTGETVRESVTLQATERSRRSEAKWQLQLWLDFD